MTIGRESAVFRHDYLTHAARANWRLTLALFSLANGFAFDDYQLGPDSMAQEGVPRGTVTQHRWTREVFPGTVRSYWIYVPAQYDPVPPLAS